ncbi:MAG TPA: NAD(P)-dependent oxidoreductase [Gemmatimonadota bacterium]|nr:NAD(P)-dependent oxidoreductase [Gemmatimonadota bacterium]
MSGSLAGRTVLVTGASRGIGRAIALRAARDGANVVIAAKTSEPHPKLPGTIHTVAAEVESAGGRALPVAVDVRDAAAVEAAVARAVETFGGVDVLVNNAGAIRLTGTLDTPVDRFDLMWAVNARAMFVCSRACLPHLRRSPNPHVLTLSPPISLDARWLAPHAPYTLSKYGMSLLVLGMAAEFAEDGVAFNALWPRTVIATAALAMLGSRVEPESCRTPEIVADAAHAIVTRDSRSQTGGLLLDEAVLREEGVTDFAPYRVHPEGPLTPDLFVD